MSTVSSSLLELILDLLSNDAERGKYEANKDAYLEKNGFSACVDEVDDVMKMDSDMRSVGHSAKADSGHSAKADNGGHSDYQVVKHVTEEHEHEHNVVNHLYGPTSHSTQNTHNGDTYDISQGDDGQVALNGGLNFGDEAEFEGDFEFTNEDSFNDANVGGDGVAATGDADVDVDGGIGNTQNGNGVMNADVDGDLNYAPGAHGSVTGDGEIDNSTELDLDVDLEGVNINSDNAAAAGDDQEGVNAGSDTATAVGDDLDVDVDVDVDVEGNNINSPKAEIED